LRGEDAGRQVRGYFGKILRPLLALSSSPRYKRPIMLKTGAQIIERVSRGSAAVRERSRGFSSLLLLGLTRGCRVR